MSLNGGAGEARTPDNRFRKPMLYPSELQPQQVYSTTDWIDSQRDSEHVWSSDRHDGRDLISLIGAKRSGSFVAE